jgi:hypothetical protein
MFKSTKEWNQFLDSVDFKKSPLSKCSKAVLDKFNAELRFENGGCAHGYYGGISSELSTEDFYAVLNTLGISEELFDDIKDTVCKVHPGSLGCEHNNSTWCNPHYCHQ